MHALLSRQPSEKLIVMLDLEYVSKGVMEWSVRWHRHGWRNAMLPEVGHRDLWEHSWNRNGPPAEK